MTDRTAKDFFEAAGMHDAAAARPGFSQLTDWAKDIHETAKAHGWYESNRELPELIALMHSELSEALEAYRRKEPDFYRGENGKPEGVGIELADCLIRILDTCAYLQIDIGEAVRLKTQYNLTRPWRHGGKRC